MYYLSDPSIRDISETILTPITEKAFAEWLTRSGQKVTLHRGRYWKEIAPGFYLPVHWLGRTPHDDATRPTSLCWGFRARLPEEESSVANATTPVHLVSDVQNYEIGDLSSDRRRKIRRFQERVEVFEILKPDLLLKEGYDVVLSAYKRNSYGRLPSLEQYREHVEEYFQLKGVLILGGGIDGKLCGYTVNHLIEGTLYSDYGVFATEALSANITSGLDFTLMEICRKSGVVSEVSLGLETPENPTLTKFKEEMGFPVVHLPARVWFAPLMGDIVRQFRPHKYYRLTGQPETLKAC